MEMKANELGNYEAMLVPSAKASNLVKDVVIQLKSRDSELIKYYQQTFKVWKEPKNNQLPQSLYLLSAMPSPEQKELARKQSDKIKRVNACLQTFERDAKKLNVSSKTLDMVKCRRKEYDFISNESKSLRERKYILSDMKSRMKELSQLLRMN